jgi:MFS family permease
MLAKGEAFVWLLIAEFWLSGLFVLSVIFLEIGDLDTLTLWTFLAYSLGSFSAGILSDIIGRRWLFVVSSCLLFISSAILLVDLTAGFILANLCIGPLNNLTFVFIH